MKKISAETEFHERVKNISLFFNNKGEIKGARSHVEDGEIYGTDYTQGRFPFSPTAKLNIKAIDRACQIGYDENLNTVYTATESLYTEYDYNDIGYLTEIRTYSHDENKIYVTVVKYEYSDGSVTITKKSGYKPYGAVQIFVYEGKQSRNIYRYNEDFEIINLRDLSSTLNDGIVSLSEGNTIKGENDTIYFDPCIGNTIRFIKPIVYDCNGMITEVYRRKERFPTNFSKKNTVGTVITKFNYIDGYKDFKVNYTLKTFGWTSIYTMHYRLNDDEISYYCEFEKNYTSRGQIEKISKNYLGIYDIDNVDKMIFLHSTMFISDTFRDFCDASSGCLISKNSKEKFDIDTSAGYNINNISRFYKSMKSEASFHREKKLERHREEQEKIKRIKEERRAKEEEENRRRDEALKKEKEEKARKKAEKEAKRIREEQELLRDRNSYYIKHLIDWESLKIEPFKSADGIDIVIEKLKELHSHKKSYQRTVLENLKKYWKGSCETDTETSIYEIAKILRKNKKLTVETSKMIHFRAYLYIADCLDGNILHNDSSKFTIDEIYEIVIKEYCITPAQVKKQFDRYYNTIIDIEKYNKSDSEKHWIVSGKASPEANLPEIYVEEDPGFENDPDWNLDLDSKDNKETEFYNSENEYIINFNQKIERGRIDNV